MYNIYCFRNVDGTYLLYVYELPIEYGHVLGCFFFFFFFGGGGGLFVCCLWVGGGGGGGGGVRCLVRLQEQLLLH